MEWFKSLSDLSSDQVVGLIAIVAIIGAFSVKATRLYFRHRERMAMIERGIHPDSLAAEEESKVSASPH